MKNCFSLGLVAFALVALSLPASASADSSSTRYGAFNLLDSRSSYGQYWFPEPLRGPEMDVDNEIRTDWLHTEGEETVDKVKTEFEKSFGMTTIEIEIPYERKVEGDERSEGLAPIEIGARFPLYQWVSDDEKLDFTLAPAVEVAIPTGTDVGQDWEIEPKLLGLLRVGDHLAIQSSVAHSTKVGPDEGGEQELEYAAVFAWVFQQGELPAPSFVQQVVPIFELVGERGINRGNYTNELSGTAGVRMNFDAIGALQPRLGLGYVFPIDSGAREEMDWGTISSFVFEF
jgi:hypothetical protein